ncbi:globin domain-containing protein [Streptomyces sp. SID14478]|uniref:globin domain-containing protein n=1 Tax=Streptomyces sp. SID14478 TaxID=2706073 RepID=UPI001EF2666B|nr:globin domain-containing protein [Streptomyces sp. SID14478]
MDAPTTTSADSGSGGGGGWFTPRKDPVTPHPAPSGPDQDSGDGRRVSPVRPVGRPEPAPTEPGEGRIPQPRTRHETEPEPAPRPSYAAPEPPPAGPVAEPRPQRRVHENASPDAILVRRTMEEVGPVADKVTSYFYALLFVRHPELRQLFPVAMDTQRDRLLRALLTAAEHVDNKLVLVPYLKNLGRGHRKYGTQPEHYPAVGECLIAALTRYATTTWDAETEAAWVRTYTTISQVMIDAAAEDELKAPAWWLAEVVSHDLRTPDIAVVTVRPGQPYPFLAGQYTTLETPWWPRIWRHYSFAAAPRSDGLLSFHVKAVPAGWVSNALVHRARPGDVLRLGPPAGSMTVDHSTDSGLLCLGGGTGIAPIKALVEDVAEHGERRPVEVFYGARTDHDLYDIDTMLRLQQSHPWLAVRPIVDRQAHLQLPDAVREYGPWNEYDAYLSGPPGMIRSGVDALRSIGIPGDRIRHDSVEELVAAGD